MHIPPASAIVRDGNRILLAVVFRRGDRAADCAALEMLCLRNGTGGSNPPLSARSKAHEFQVLDSWAFAFLGVLSELLFCGSVCGILFEVLPKDWTSLGEHFSP